MSNTKNPPTSPPTTFKDENRVLQELARELDQLRKHNLGFREGDPQNTMLMFAEAGVVCMALEHFVRIVLGPLGNSPDGKGLSLHNLLEKAVAEDLIKLPWVDQQDGIRQVCSWRNSLLHANYAQSAREAGCSSDREYFRKQFAPMVETMFKTVDHVMKQIDPVTGRPYPR